MKVPKKIIKQIDQLSFIHDVIKEKDGVQMTKNPLPHWTDTPPDQWTREETEIYDLLCEHEHKMKQAISKILQP